VNQTNAITRVNRNIEVWVNRIRAINHEPL